MKEYKVVVSDYKFACFIEDCLKRAGVKISGAAMGDQGRELFFKHFDIPARADFLPEPIEANAPNLEAPDEEEA